MPWGEFYIAGYILFFYLGPGNRCAFILSKSIHLGSVYIFVCMSYFNKILFKIHKKVNLEGKIIKIFLQKNLVKFFS